MSTLSVIATPIGNLEDITLRALRVLGEADYILAEDTRVTKKLLTHYKISKPLISYHQHSDEKKIKEIIELLLKKKNLALVTDAGTPGIADPGGWLIKEILEKTKREEVTIEVIPGPSAIISALSISGLNTDKFLFLGFLPHKKGRQKLLSQATKEKYPVIFYESKHRLLKLLQELNILIEKKDIIVFRELTKQHETVYRGTPAEIKERLTKNIIEQKGEFTIIL